ncbi:MAG: hypothetical protein RXS23_10905 [Metallosphaera yellowstonensis]
MFGLILFAAATSMYVGFSTPNTEYVNVLSSQIFKGPIPHYTLPSVTYSAFFGTVTLFVFAYAEISAAPMLEGEAKNPKRTCLEG